MDSKVSGSTVSLSRSWGKEGQAVLRGTGGHELRCARQSAHCSPEGHTGGIGQGRQPLGLELGDRQGRAGDLCFVHRLSLSPCVHELKKSVNQ
jgi:hypothetical protein